MGNQEKNSKQLKHYFHQLFNRYARLCVVRLDLMYEEKLRDHVTFDQVKADYQRAKVDREHLYRNMRHNHLFRHLVGFVWKMEYGLMAGFHYHCFFIFDGSKVREDVTVARSIGEYWKQVVTGGQGRYYSCNADKARYGKHCGIGSINHFDLEPKRNLINYAANYLTKPDLFSKVIVRGDDQPGRLFGKWTVKPRKNQRGATRRHLVQGN
jgi:hypothetical protein